MSNPFELLGLAPSFAIEPELLEQRQRDLNRALHPDRHAGKSPGERREALGRSMDVNRAYRTLRDPASRAEALFELLGESWSSERTVTDPTLLGEMLEQREQLDEIRRNKDMERLKLLAREMRARESALVEQMARAFQPLTDALPVPAGGARPQLSTVRRLLTELRYVRRFVEEVGAIEDEM
jgi:molecular chaperone HscB